MSQTLTLPSMVYRKLARRAAERGMTVEALVTRFADVVALPDQPSKRDRQRSARIGRLLDRFRTGELDADDREELDALIGLDYEEANARADRLIAKRNKGRNGRSRKSE